MEKFEFEKLVGAEVSNEDWLNIHAVYQWYPLISVTEGKNQVAWLYLNLGINVFHDLMSRAAQIAQLELHRQELLVKYNKEVDEVNKKVDKISKFLCGEYD